MACEAPAAALGNLMFGQRCQETSGRPAFLVGLGGERDPDLLDGGQPQLGEEQLDAGGVAGIGRSHAAPTSWTVLSSSLRCRGATSPVMSGMAGGLVAEHRPSVAVSGSLSSSRSVACGTCGTARHAHITRPRTLS